MKNFDYGRAEADLEDMGHPCPDEVYGYKTEKGFNSFMRENGLNPERYSHENGGNSNNSGGCFLTTACTAARGLPDDCEELETLRWFRDNWLCQQPDGEAAIRHYYDIAPQIVERINDNYDASLIWDGLYYNMILPCVSLIKAGKYQETYALYQSNALELETRYADSDSVSRGKAAPDPCEDARFDEALFRTALEIVFAVGYASTSMIQRTLRLGYARAAHIIDRMEEQGVVAPFDGGSRRLLITKEQWEQEQLPK